MPPNTSPVNFRPGRFRLAPGYKLWPDMTQAADIGAPQPQVKLPSALRIWPDAFPALLAPAFPETPPIPPTVASGDLITAVHENTVTEGISDLWVDLQWLAANVAINPTTSKGDLIVNNGSALARLPVGADTQVLTTDLTQPLGMKWATPTASGSFVPTSRQVIAGAGMSGGGALTADVTLNALVTSVFGRTGAVVLTSADIAAAGGVPATRRVIAGAGMSGGGALTADVTLNANVTSVFGRTGDVVLGAGDITGAGGVPATRSILAGVGLSGGGDLTADRTLAVVDDTSTQRAQYSKDGALVATRRGLNVITGANVAITMADDAANNRVNLTIASTATGGGGSQTPWLQDVNAAGFSLSGVKGIGMPGGVPAPTGGGININGSAALEWGVSLTQFSATNRAGFYLSNEVGDYCILGVTGSSHNATNLQRNGWVTASRDFVIMAGGLTERVRVTSAGFVAIGGNVPSYLLSLGNTLGDKLAVYDGGPGQIYGFGIQSYQFQIMAPASLGRVSVGCGTSAAFTEVLTVRANGCVGIGKADPADALVVVGLPGNAYGQIRIAYGNYGVFFRHDNVTFYCMTTASGDPFGTWTSTPPWQIDLASNRMSINSLTLPSVLTLNSGLDSTGQGIFSQYYGTADWGGGALQIRENARVTTAGPFDVAHCPRISFHWGGVVAAQFGMDWGGTIRTFDNPGTGYAPFTSGSMYAVGTITAEGTVSFSTAVYGNGKEVANTADVYLRINQSNQFSSGIWFGPSALKMASGHLFVGTTGVDTGCVDISATAADAVNRVLINGNASAANVFNTGGNFGINLPNPTDMLTINLGASGNVKMLAQPGYGASFIAAAYGNSLFSANANVSGGWKYDIAGAACQMQLSSSNGSLLMADAASGSAGAAITWRYRWQSFGDGSMAFGGTMSAGSGGGCNMYLSATGYAGIRTISPNSILTIVQPTNQADVAIANQQLALCEGTDNAQYRMTFGYVVIGGAYWVGAIQTWAGGVGAQTSINPKGGPVTIGTTAQTANALLVNGDTTVQNGRILLNGAPSNGISNMGSFPYAAGWTNSPSFPTPGVGLNLFINVLYLWGCVIPTGTPAGGWVTVGTIPAGSFRPPTDRYATISAATGGGNTPAGFPLRITAGAIQIFNPSANAFYFLDCQIPMWT